MANTDLVNEGLLGVYHDELMKTHLAGCVIFDISAYNPTNGQPTPYADLAAALGTNGANVPEPLRKGGMSVKFVQSSDNKYVQCRLTKNEWSVLVTDWKNVGDFVEEIEHPIAEENVVGYLTDKKKSIIAKLMNDGSVEWLVKNSNDIAIDTHFENIEDILSYVSSEVPTTSDVIKYLTDVNNNVIATINNVGDTEFKGGGGFAGEITKDKSIGFDAVKVLTDKRNSVVGWITSGGKVHLEELHVNNIEVEGNTNIGIPEQLFPLLGIIANGTENHKFVNDKTLNLLFAQKGEYVKEGVPVKTYPVISIHDDDSCDRQMPTSYVYGATDSTAPTSGYRRSGGFASRMWPLYHALNVKHAAEIKGKITTTICAEGQRIGLTPFYGLEDTFNGELNANGKMVKALVEKDDWECECHSMTARYITHSYLVNGLDSEFAQSLLVNATYDGANGLRYNTTTCYDTVTKKNYKVKPIPAGETDSPGWDELPAHYAKPHLALSKDSDSKLVPNPGFSQKYQVKTWFDRAGVAGLPYISVVQPWGTSHGSDLIVEDMKYADNVIFRLDSDVVNMTPQLVCPFRCPLSANSSDEAYNVYTKKRYKSLLDVIDTCAESGGWLIFASHYYYAEFDNYYRSAYSDLYGADSAECGPLCYKDDNYPEEWVVPLKYEELMDMIGDNVHDYWNNPPARLNIQSWGEWYPCPGTVLAMVYDVMEYAISKGITFARTQDVLKERGNMFAIGCEAVDDIPIDKRLDPEYRINSFCRIGADGSIVYKSK